MKSNLIKINGTEYKVRKTLRAVFRFELATERPFEIKNTLDSYLYFYCVLLANNPDMTMTWKDFIDINDKDPSVFVRISEILSESNEMERLLGAEEAEGDQEGETQKKN